MTQGIAAPTGTPVPLQSLNPRVSLYLKDSRQVMDFGWPFPVYEVNIEIIGEQPRYSWRSDERLLVFAQLEGTPVTKVEVKNLFHPGKAEDGFKLMSLDGDDMVPWFDRHETYTRRQRSRLVPELREFIECQLRFTQPSEA
jgi:hypothetical protein